MDWEATKAAMYEASSAHEIARDPSAKRSASSRKYIAGARPTSRRRSRSAWPGCSPLQIAAAEEWRDLHRVPEKFRVGHEAHFQVTRFFEYDFPVAARGDSLHAGGYLYLPRVPRGGSNEANVTDSGVALLLGARESRRETPTRAANPADDKKGLRQGAGRVPDYAVRARVLLRFKFDTDLLAGLKSGQAGKIRNAIILSGMGSVRGY
jgi:hypothetical protein